MNAAPILIAEDDVSDAMMIQRVLKETGIINPVHLVRDGSDLILYLTSQGSLCSASYPLPALVLLDLRMPTPGSKVLEWLAAHPEFSGLPVVVTTDSANMRDIRKAYDLGASSFLMKPITKEDLMNLLRGLRKIRVDYGDGAICLQASHLPTGNGPGDGTAPKAIQEVAHRSDAHFLCSGSRRCPGKGRCSRVSSHR